MSDSLSFDLIVRDDSARGLNKFADNVEKAGQKAKGAGRHISQGFDESGKSVDRATARIAKFNSAADKMSDHASKAASKGLGPLAMAAAGLGPAIVPIAVAGVPAVLGLGAAFASAGAAGMVFGKVLGATFTEVQETADAHDELREKIKAYGEEAKLAAARGDDEGAKAALEAQKVATQELAAAQKALPPGQGQVISQYRGMKLAAQQFVDANKPATYGIMGMAFDMVGEHIGKLQPLFDVGARAAGNFLIALQGWARGGGLKSMVDFLAKNGEQTFARLQLILGNLATGFGHMFRATAGQGQGMLQWITEMSAKFASFGAGGGWDRFVNYTTQNGPQVMAVLTNIGTSLLTLVQAVTPLAPISLAVAAALTSIIAAVPPEVLTAIVGGFLAYSVAMKAYAAGVMIASVATKGMAAAQKVLNVAMRMNPIGLVVTALVLLGTALVVAYKKSETFRNIVNGAFRAVKATASAVFKFIGNVAKAVWGAITAYIRFQINVWKTIISGVKSFATNAWNVIKSVGKATWSAVSGAVKTAVDKAKSLIETMRTKAKSVLDRIKALFSPTTLLNAGRQLIQGLINGIQEKIDGAVNMVKGGLDSIKGMLPGSPIQHGPLLSWNGGGAGKRLMELLAKGISKGSPAYAKAMAQAIDVKTPAASAATGTRRASTALAVRATGAQLAAKAAAVRATKKPNDVRRARPMAGRSGGGGGGGITIQVNISGTNLSTPEGLTTAVVKAVRQAKSQGYVIPVGTFQGA